jgi:hypothetical protein
MLMLRDQGNKSEPCWLIRDEALMLLKLALLPVPSRAGAGKQVCAPHVIDRCPGVTPEFRSSYDCGVVIEFIAPWSTLELTWVKF